MSLAAVAHALDRVRSPAIKAVLEHSAWLRRTVSSRALRIEAFALASIAVALLVALSTPTLAFVWGPLLLGVPHLVADVRYLTLAPYSPIPKRARDLAVVALLASTLWWPLPVVGGAAVVAALGLSPLRDLTARTIQVRAFWCVIATSIWVLLWRFPIQSSYLLMHAHNAVAVLLFACVFGRGRARWVVPAATACMCALVLAGALDPWLQRPAFDDLAGYLLPRSALADWAPISCARVAVLFVFLQGVHYAIWLRLIPEQARPCNGLRSFGASLRALQRDLGGALVVLIVALALSVILLGLLDSFSARQEYLRLASFHAYLELACFARWLAR
jgi:hypothetical protein